MSSNFGNDALNFARNDLPKPIFACFFASRSYESRIQGLKIKN